MASPSILVDRVKHGGGDHAHERREHVTRQNGCHGSDKTITETLPEENSAVPKAKGSKKSKKVDGKKIRKAQTYEQTLSNPQQKSLSQQTEEVQKSMSGLNICDNSKQRGRIGGLTREEGETGSKDSVEARLNKLSLEDNQQLIERGPQRNRESHPVRQSKPYDKSAVPSPKGLANADQASCPGSGVSGEDEDAFIKSVLYDKDIVGVSNDVPAQPPPAAVPSNVQTTSQTSMNYADEWLCNTSSSSGTGDWHMSPATTTSGQYQLSGPVQNCMYDMLDYVPVQTTDQLSGQLPVMSQTPTVALDGASLMPVQGTHGIQQDYVFSSIPLNNNTVITPCPTHIQQTIVSDQSFHQIFPNTPVSFVNGVLIPIASNFVDISSATSNNNPSSVVANPVVGFCQPPALNGTMGHCDVQNNPISGNLVPCVSIVHGQNGFSCDQAHPCVGTQSHVKLEEENNSGRDPSIPNVVPTVFDEEPDKDIKSNALRKKGRGNTSIKTASGSKKKEKKKKESPKKPSTPTQSSSPSITENVSPLCTTPSSQSNCRTSLEDSGETIQSVPVFNGTDFEDAIEVVKDLLQEDFMAKKLRKRTSRASKSGELGQNDISYPPNKQLTQTESALSPQPQNAEYSRNNLILQHQQDIAYQPANPPVEQYQQKPQFTQSIPVDQQLNQFPQIQYNQQVVTSATFTDASFNSTLSTRVVSNGQPSVLYQPQTTHAAMAPTETGTLGHSAITSGRNTSVLQETPTIQYDQQTTLQEYGQQAYHLPSQQAAYRQPSQQATYQECGNQTVYQQPSQQAAHHQFGHQMTYQQGGQHLAYQQEGQPTVNHSMPVYQPQATGYPPVPQQPAPSQSVNPRSISTTCQTKVQVSVTHQTPRPSVQQQTKPVAQSPPQGIATFPLAMGGHKMITAGSYGASPMGASSAIEVILRRYPPIRPKPTV